MRPEKRPAPDGDDSTGDGKNIGNVGIFGSSKFGPFNVTESSAPKKAKPVVTKQEDSRGPGASPFVPSTRPRGLHEPCVGIGRLSKSIVAIRAGPGRETFFVHPHLLMGCSEFRRQLGTVANGVTEIDLPDEDPDIISLMIFWCYEGKLPSVKFSQQQEPALGGADATNKDTPTQPSRGPMTTERNVSVTTVGDKLATPKLFVPDVFTWNAYLGETGSSPRKPFRPEFYQLKILKLAIMASKKDWPELFRSAVRIYCKGELQFNRTCPAVCHIDAVCTFNAPREVSGLMMDYARYLFDRHGTLFTFANNTTPSGLTFGSKPNPSVSKFMAELRTVEKYSKVPSENPLRQYAPPAEDAGNNSDDSKEGGQV
ncbi:hypothetical protein COL26b_010334 [Colletotrichum chrysophilum]|uniref:uncharacterized protein n=1 Tax=Colletotrichum chrysophilum TaxID=1836956 RepID=UPI002301CACA|nr:uncharacterized protein COL26b_010334 [Colletotrichum chrysophilum]KAJ0344308.1 hypothetical protein KNSL1_009491 [Colletotrichum chrysophilum]KAJ0369724.1 hypothetical protein COL26b_010334 [Colletotrichum chrysophilum]